MGGKADYQADDSDGRAVPHPQVEGDHPADVPPPEDIRWFRRIEVYTKYGRTGHIIEPLGTHGYMKVQFDGILDAGDTVCLPLYTRIYPQIDTRVVDVETVIEPHTLGEVGGGLSL